MIKLYGEIVIDDAKTPTESGSSYKPGAQAYNIGGSINVRNTKIWAEYGETSEWMYVTNYLPYLRINVRKFFIQNIPGGRFMPDYPVGFIYGPDAKMFSVGINGELKEFDLSYSFEYNHLIKGQVNDNGTVRWKWFWDSWPGNVTEAGATTPPKVEDAIYDIFSFEVKWKNLSLFGKSVNFNNYIFGLMFSQ